MKFVLILISISFLATVSHGKSETYRKRIYKELGLSHSQAKSLFLVRKKKQIRVAQLQKKLKRVQGRINRALIADKSDKLLQKLHREKIILQARIKQERFNSTLSVRKLLSKKQRKSYLQMKKKYSLQKSGKKTQSL